MKDFDRYDSAFRALSPRVQASPAGKAVADYIAAVRATQVGNTTPDFALEDIDGQMLRLSDLRGQYVLLDFWGTWCGGCRASIPSLVALYDQLKDKNFEIVGIAVNEYNDSYWRKVIADEKLYDSFCQTTAPKPLEQENERKKIEAFGKFCVPVRNDRSARRLFHVQNTRKRPRNVKIRLHKKRFLLIFYQRYFIFIENRGSKKG